MDKDMPADWAMRRAQDIMLNDGFSSFWASFARYIEAHEQPPVDPDLVTAREICARAAETMGAGRSAPFYRNGDCDEQDRVQFALAKLKEARGK